MDARLIHDDDSECATHQPRSCDAQWLFAYGSLVAQCPRTLTRNQRRDGVIADLPGYRRTWGVAMDNRVDIAGYKYYVDPDTGVRPDVRVAFLDLAPDPGHVVNGVCRPVTWGQLHEFDTRERQYLRVDVSSAFSGIDATVWTYIGSPSGRQRRTDGDRTGTTVVARAYRDTVLAGFEGLGRDEYAAFVSSTSECGCPVIPLVRHDLLDVR